MFIFAGKLGLKETLVWLVLIVTLGVGIYSNTWHAPFVFDDIHSIVQNEARQTIKWSFEALLGTRSVSYFTLDVNYSWGGLAVEGYHAINIIIHVITSTLITTFIYLAARQTYSRIVWRYRRITIDNHWLLAFTGGLFFLTHPIQTQSVNYIVQRMVLLTTMFYVGALIAYWLYRISQKRRVAVGWAVLSLMSSVLAMHTKEIAFTLPAAVVLVEYFFFSKTWRKLIRRWLLLPWLMTALIIPAYLLDVGSVFIHDDKAPLYTYDQNIFDKVNLTRIDAVSAETPEITRGTYFVTQWSVITRYLSLIVWPVGLNIDHDIPWQDSWLNVKSLSSLTIILGIAGAGVWLMWRGKVFGAVGIALFFITLSVESSVIPIKDNIFEHRLYLPMVGVTLIAVEGLAWCVTRVNRPEGRVKDGMRWIGMVIILMLIVFGSLTYARNGVWASALTLWSDAAEKSPEKARPLNNLGLAWEEQRQWDKAEKNYRQGLEYNPENVELMVNLGALLGKTNKTNEATEVLKKAIKIDPNLASSYINLGNVYSLRKDFLQAEEAYRQALELSKNNAGTWASLGDALIAQGRKNEAIEVFEQAVTIKNDEAGWFNRLGALYAMTGQLAKAEVAFNQSLALDPKLKTAQDNLRQLKRDQAKVN